MQPPLQSTETNTMTTENQDYTFGLFGIVQTAMECTIKIAIHIIFAINDLKMNETYVPVVTK